MVNMFGAGRAMDLHYAQRAIMPKVPQNTQVRTYRQAPPRRSGSINFNYNFNNRAFNIMTGFALANTLLFGLGSFIDRIVGRRHQQVVTTETQTTSQDTRLADLKTLYQAKGVNIIQNGDNFTATDKNGDNIAVNVTYNQMCEILGNYKPSNADTPTQPQKPETQGNDEGEPVQDDGNHPVQGDRNQGNNQDGAGNVQHATGRGTVPKGWYNVNSDGNKNMKTSLQAATQGKGKGAAEAAMNKILQGKMDYLGKGDREDLLTKFIDANPSVFNKDGSVRSDAQWDKLDIPPINYLKNQYVKNASYNTKTGKVSYDDKSGNTVQNNSKINKDNYSKKPDKTGSTGAAANSSKQIQERMKSLSPERQYKVASTLNKINQSKLPENKKEELRAQLNKLMSGIVMSQAFSKGIEEINSQIS